MQLYNYRATVLSVYDGDSIRVDVDLGFGIILKNQSLRLLGLDTPEIRGEERPLGLIARDFVRQRLPVGEQIKISTVKDRREKYGRYLAVIYYGADMKNLNDELIQNGLAEAYE